MRPEFSEREFEFCFNAEFIRKNRDAIIGTPFIPSQRLETFLGFDVKFRLQQGNIEHSLFLQHKVSHFVSIRYGKYARLFDFHDGSYFYFNLVRLEKSPQHNLLYSLQQSGEEVYYSAPLFYDRNAFTQHFVDNAVIDNSIFIDPSGIGQITDLDLHRISYSQNGTKAAFCSDPEELGSPLDFKNLSKTIKKRKIDEKYFEKLFILLIESLKSVYRAKLSLPAEYLKLPYVSQCAFLLRRYYKLQWVMF